MPEAEPAAPTFESVWLVEATYAPNGAESRKPVRAEHLARLAELKRSGIIVEVGALADVSASIMIVRAASEAEAVELFRDDVYLRTGVWVEIRVRPFARLVTA
jgi:hypothetical protein